MIVRIDPQSATPPYEQVRAQIATMAAAGTLAAGSRLPTVRQLAADLGVAGGTVARAYRELEAAGVVETRGRHGTFVAARPAPPADVRRALLAEAAKTFAVEAVQAGAKPDDALDAVARAMNAISAV